MTAGASEIPQYDHGAIELRLQERWRQSNAFQTPAVTGADAAAGASTLRLAPQHAPGPHWIYIKASAPFTSGNIHMGHVRSYAIGDAYARFRRACGDKVLFAFGYDAFGLPAEQGAIANSLHPSDWVRGCAERMTGQLSRLGFSFDWERSFISSEPLMYRWSQWLFLRLLAAGLIYRGTGTVDWCPSCNTTLASIQVEAGTCWRCHGPVELVERPQWFLRISAYVEENDRRAEELQLWEETALGSQREVLGRMAGFELELAEAGDPAGARTLTAFTQHPEEIAEAAFVAISPRHPKLADWTAEAAVAAALEQMRTGGWERSARDAHAVSLIDTNHRLALPGGQQTLPVIISPLVDSRFGPTAVLGIPACDRTDAVIAERLGLATAERDQPPPAQQTGAGNGAAAAASARAAAANGAGAAGAERPAGLLRPSVRYRARDFSISRQRYWGTPIPIVYCEQCGVVALREQELPLLLPGDLHPTGSENPLAAHAEFYETTCPQCGAAGRRETDTLDCHFDALWLWVPACVPPQERERALEEIFALDDLRAWLPSERLVAGSDSGNFMFDQRIVTKALRDLGPLEFLPDGEPFAGALLHEMVIRDGRKMSKHLGNVVEPDALVEELGADTVRLAVLYAARPQRSLNWSESAVAHCGRFLRSLWSFCQEQLAVDHAALASCAGEAPSLSTDHLRRRLVGWYETATEKVTEDVADLEMHKAIRNIMRLLERVRDFPKRVIDKRGAISREDQECLLGAIERMLDLLAPFAPHISAELLAQYELNGSGDGAHAARSWPAPAESGVERRQNDSARPASAGGGKSA